MNTSNADRASTGLHEGEIAVQDRVCVRADAQRLSRMPGQADLTGSVADFLARRTLVVIAARDQRGRSWTSPLTGDARFFTWSTRRLFGSTACTRSGTHFTACRQINRWLWSRSTSQSDAGTASTGTLPLPTAPR